MPDRALVQYRTGFLLGSRIYVKPGASLREMPGHAQAHHAKSDETYIGALGIHASSLPPDAGKPAAGPATTLTPNGPRSKRRVDRRRGRGYPGGTDGRRGVFEMDDRILETVIFAMENQGAVSYIDLDTGLLSSRVDVSAVSEDPGGEDPDREPIPVWTSQDGFRLMEQFAQTIGHPLVRADLLAALSRGRGVFRAFKDALDTHPEAERKWYEYKSRAMKARIVDWYEELREVRGLAKLGLEPEDTDDLLLSDFRILRHGPEAWKEFADLVREGREDALSRFPPSSRGARVRAAGPGAFRCLRRRVLHPFGRVRT